MLYFSHGGTHLNQTFTLCTWVLTQHILWILLKRLLRYSSLNFKVHFFKWPCNCILNIYEQWIKFFTAFNQEFQCFNHEWQMPIPHYVFKQCSQCKYPPAAATQYDPNLMQIDTIALSMNLWSKSFCIIDKTIFQLRMMLASFSICLW